MSDETVILHNPSCSTSRSAVGASAEAAVTIRNYLTDPLSEGEWREVLAILADPPADLVRRDANFAAAGLNEEDVQTAGQVAKVLAAHPILAQRPVLIRGSTAIIGRPRERAAEFLA